MNLPNKKQFEANADDIFEIAFDGTNKHLCRIEEIKASMAPGVGQQDKQFSIVFNKPTPEVYDQGVYAISHPGLGEFELFLVPIFGDDKGVHYEAIFT